MVFSCEAGIHQCHWRDALIDVKFVVNVLKLAQTCEQVIVLSYQFSNLSVGVQACKGSDYFDEVEVLRCSSAQ